MFDNDNPNPVGTLRDFISKTYEFVKLKTVFYKFPYRTKEEFDNSFKLNAKQLKALDNFLSEYDNVYTPSPKYYEHIKGAPIEFRQELGRIQVSQIRSALANGNNFSDICEQFDLRDYQLQDIIDCKRKTTFKWK
jgi:hypothetical protein